jgi:two-component system, chemotaxis family, response regulator Rcp1
MPERNQSILLVEDRPQDVRLTLRALKKAGFAHVNVTVAEHGKKALEILRREPPYEKAERPDLVLLDWMMPLVNGEEVLMAMRQDPILKRIPVIVLTTSRSEIDINTAADNGCNAYLTKPISPLDFQKKINSFGNFWLETAELPLT